VFGVAMVVAALVLIASVVELDHMERPTSALHLTRVTLRLRGRRRAAYKGGRSPCSLLL